MPCADMQRDEGSLKTCTQHALVGAICEMWAAPPEGATTCRPALHHGYLLHYFMAQTNLAAATVETLLPTRTTSKRTFLRKKVSTCTRWCWLRALRTSRASFKQFFHVCVHEEDIPKTWLTQQTLAQLTFFSGK